MPKIVNHEERRQSILDHSFLLFAENGFHGVSVRQIAKANGMTTGMLYHYFPGKPEIFQELLTTMQQRQIHDFKQSLKTQDNAQFALMQFVQKEQQSLQNLLSIAIDFHRVHPERDISTLLDPYEEAIRDSLQISSVQAKQMLTMILGDLARRLIGG